MSKETFNLCYPPPPAEKLQNFFGVFLQFHFGVDILACDEIAEVLDKTGLNKEEKEIISKIERCLSLIARQGRAFGIHLILATQRPSADLIPGQIRTNLTLRICGRADNILSRIILDSPAAAEQIPLDVQGRFVTNMGQIFQGYLFDDSILEP